MLYDEFVVLDLGFVLFQVSVICASWFVGGLPNVGRTCKLIVLRYGMFCSLIGVCRLKVSLRYISISLL